MAATGRRTADRTTHTVLASFTLLTSLPFVIAATHGWYWRNPHATTLKATALFAGLLIALLLRQRWAWVLLVLLEIASLVSFAFDSTLAPLAIALTLATLPLLLSPPMRSYVRR